tara:strand:+ start:39 stop:725 length:687 start_codon:yes stop_codon:yes gene_type:complete
MFNDRADFVDGLLGVIGVDGMQDPRRITEDRIAQLKWAAQDAKVKLGSGHRAVVGKYVPIRSKQDTKFKSAQKYAFELWEILRNEKDGSIERCLLMELYRALFDIYQAMNCENISLTPALIDSVHDCVKKFAAWGTSLDSELDASNEKIVKEIKKYEARGFHCLLPCLLPCLFHMYSSYCVLPVPVFLGTVQNETLATKSARRRTDAPLENNWCSKERKGEDEEKKGE